MSLHGCSRILATGCLSLLVGLAHEPANADSGLELPKLSQWRLDNGLEVAFMPVRKAPVVTVQVWYHAGSKDEARDRRGSAHMFEHMMFKGTEHVRPEEHARLINGVGGAVNAFTTEDVTAYHDTLPAEYLDFAIQLEAERMTGLLFRDAMIDTEREVVKEEIRQQENNPIARGFLRFLEVAYGVHPYGWTAGGTIADLDKTTTDDLKTFYSRYYVPNNALVVVVGDVSEEAVRASVAKWFGRIPKGAEPPRPADASPEPAQTEKRREVTAPSQVGVVIAGYHVPEATHGDTPALQVLGQILGAGESSRLHQRLVRTDKKALEVGSEALIREHPGMLMVLAAFLDPKGADTVEASLLDEVSRVTKVPPTPRELAKAKNQLLSNFVFSMENVAGLAQQIGMSWVQSGDPGRFEADLARLRAVTAKDVQRVARTYLDAGRSTVVVIPPAGGSK